MMGRLVAALLVVLVASCARKPRRRQVDAGEGRILNWANCADDWRKRPETPSIAVAANSLGDLFTPGERAEAVALLDEILRRVHDAELSQPAEHRSAVPKAARRYAAWLADLLPRVGATERRRILLQIVAVSGDCGRSPLDLYYAAHVLAHPDHAEERSRLSPPSKEILALSPTEADIRATARDLERELSTHEKRLEALSPKPQAEILAVARARARLQEIDRGDFSHLNATLCRDHKMGPQGCPPESFFSSPLPGYESVLSEAYGAKDLDSIE